jgi:tryptophan synthase beta chain
MRNNKVDFSQFPDAAGHFGRYGGRFVAETLMEALHEAERRLAGLSQ